MSRFPEMSSAGASVPASIFARLREHLARYGGDVIPLQIGDTYLAPPARLDAIGWADHAPSELYAYGAPTGWTPLVEAIVEKVAAKNAIAITPAQVQIACGATHALSCAVQALCDPGDELILLTPHWPLIRGIALGHHVAPIEVPFSMRLPASDVTALIEPAITPRTSAIYVATPNNPDGAMLSAAELRAIAGLADRHGLWLLSDEVYEDYGYEATHASLAAQPGAAERTVTVFSFAKSYAQAGLRVGYAIGPELAIATIRKLINHSVYNVPVAMQRAALGALRTGEGFLATARDAYRTARDRVRARLHVPTDNPAGGAYVWLDLRQWSSDDCMPVLERCAAAGVLLAPGSAFGAPCAGFARLCFTGVEPAVLDEGIDRINAVIGSL
ncbi:MAG: pyridoxal phosphate-dependent aminotransferase [Kofleriaceae bacterium]